MTVNSITKFRNWLPPTRGFLSPGNGGNEGGVKTIEAGGEVNHSALKSDTIFLYILYMRVRET